MCILRHLYILGGIFLVGILQLWLEAFPLLSLLLNATWMVLVVRGATTCVLVVVIGHIL